MVNNIAVAQFVYKYPDDDSSTLDFFPGTDICELLNSNQIYSLGIQAPYGTPFYLNGQKAYIGPTGVFELDQVITITSLKIGLENVGDEGADYLSRVIVDVIYGKGVTN